MHNARKIPRALPPAPNQGKYRAFLATGRCPKHFSRAGAQTTVLKIAGIAVTSSTVIFKFRTVRRILIGHGRTLKEDAEYVVESAASRPRRILEELTHLPMGERRKYQGAVINAGYTRVHLALRKCFETCATRLRSAAAPALVHDLYRLDT